MERAHRALHPGEACSLGSLNGLSRKRELQRIARDNQAILRRIQERQSQKSCYDRQMMDNEWQQTLMYRRLASQHQEGGSPTLDRSAPHSKRGSRVRVRVRVGVRVRSAPHSKRGSRQ